MNDELKRAQQHLQGEVLELLSAVLAKEYEQAQEHAEVVVTLINHVSKIKSREES